MKTKLLFALGSVALLMVLATPVTAQSGGQGTTTSGEDPERSGAGGKTGSASSSNSAEAHDSHRVENGALSSSSGSSGAHESHRVENGALSSSSGSSGAHESHRVENGAFSSSSGSSGIITTDEPTTTADTPMPTDMTETTETQFHSDPPTTTPTDVPTTTEMQVTDTTVPTTTEMQVTDTTVPTTTEMQVTDTTVPTTTAAPAAPDCQDETTEATCLDARFESNEYKRCRWTSGECWPNDCSFKSGNPETCQQSGYCTFNASKDPACDYSPTTTTTTTTPIPDGPATTTTTTAAPHNGGCEDITTPSNCDADAMCEWMMSQANPNGVCQNKATTTTAAPEGSATPAATQEWEVCSKSNLVSEALCVDFRWQANPKLRCRWSSEHSECWFDSCSVKDKTACDGNSDCAWHMLENSGDDGPSGFCKHKDPVTPAPPTQQPVTCGSVPLEQCNSIPGCEIADDGKCVAKQHTQSPDSPLAQCVGKNNEAECDVLTHCAYNHTDKECQFSPDCTVFGMNLTACRRSPFDMFCHFVEDNGCRPKHQQTAPPNTEPNQPTNPCTDLDPTECTSAKHCTYMQSENKCSFTPNCAEVATDKCNTQPFNNFCQLNEQNVCGPKPTEAPAPVICMDYDNKQDDCQAMVGKCIWSDGKCQQVFPDTTTTTTAAPEEETTTTTESPDVMPTTTTGAAEPTDAALTTTTTDLPMDPTTTTAEPNPFDCVRIEPSFTYSAQRIYPEQGFDASLSADLIKCDGTKWALPLSFKWSVAMNGKVQDLNVDTSKGEFKIPRNTLSAGKIYTVWAEVIFAFHTLKFKKSMSVNITVIEDLPNVIIAGGDREVNSKEFKLAARITDPDGDVINEKVTWLCASDSCPAALESIPAGPIVTLKDVPAGVFRFKCRYTNSKGKYAYNYATLTVKATPVLGIQLQSSVKEGQSHLVTDTLKVSAFLDSATSGVTQPTFSWTVNSLPLQSSEKVLSFAPAVIATYIKDKPWVQDLTFTCTATHNGITGKATVVVPLMRAVTPGTCSVLRLVNALTAQTSSTGFVGGESIFIISADNWPQVEGLYYRWMYQSPTTNRLVPLSNLATSATKFSEIVPLVSSEKLKFVVVGILDNRKVATTTCEISVSQPSDVSAVTRTQLENMKKAVSSGNSAQVLNAASIAAAGSKSSGSETEQAANRKEIMSSLKNQFANTSKPESERTTMSTEEKLGTVDILASVLGAGKEDQSRVAGSEASDVKDLLGSILTVGAGEDFDSESLNGPVLDIVASLRGTDDAAVIEKTRKLAQLSAQQLGSGEKQVTKNDAFAMTAEKRAAADAIGSVMSSDKTKVLLSSAVLDALGPNVGVATPLALQTIEYDESPVDVPAGKALASSPVELDLSVGDNLANLFGLSQPIELRFKAHDIVLNGTRRPSCNFLNKTAANKEDWFWSDQGVTVGPLDIEAGEVICYTTHFSMFAAMTEDDDAVESGDVPTTDEDSSVGIVIGVCAGGFLIIALGAGFIVTRNKKGLDSGDQDRHLEEGTGENDQPLLRTIDNHSQEEEGIEMRQTRHTRNPI